MRGDDIPDDYPPHAEDRAKVDWTLVREMAWRKQAEAMDRLRWVHCEACGGSGEIIRSNPVGAYQEPDEYAELCGACDGTGRDCVAVLPVECDDALEP